MFGTVTRYYKDKNYGFIRGEDGNTYFIHASKLCGEQIERGYYVHFKPFMSDRSDYNAKNVNVIEVPESSRSSKTRKKKGSKSLCKNRSLSEE